jgi:HAE1 family hydrophobic/amphiphilic exporter-1/multidrug efflux pump
MYVKNNKGDLIQMDICGIEEQSKPPQLYHNNRFMAATVSAGLAQAKASMMELKPWNKSQRTGDTFTTDLGGESRDFVKVVSILLSHLGWPYF